MLIFRLNIVSFPFNSIDNRYDDAIPNRMVIIADGENNKDFLYHLLLTEYQYFLIVIDIRSPSIVSIGNGACMNLKKLN